MVTRNMMTLCRICLNNGATCPIFEDTKNDNNIYAKLFECFKEKIADVEGYPRNICLSCNCTLETVCNFIKKFRETCKILEGGLLYLKKESKSDISDNEPDGDFTEIEINFNSIKPEPDALLVDLKNTEQFIELFEPLPNVKETKIKKEYHKNKTKLKYHKNKYDNKTDKIASSILEGEFAWTGDQWCLKSTQVKIPKENIVKGKRRDTKLKLPKKEVIKQPKLCDLCGETFITQYKLNVHRRKVHFKNPVQCPKCPHISTTEYNLKRHTKRRHEDIRNFVCSFCGKRLTFKSELTNHVRKYHSKNPPPRKMFSCKYCDKTYKSSKSVIIHERSFHTGERPAECTICKKGFYHEDYLKEHMRLHTGEAPFKCPICGRGYAQRGNMKSHMRIHRITEVDAVTLSKLKPNYLKLLKV